MWTPIIGRNAGALWKILNNKGEHNLSALKKQAKLDDKNFYLALGWLAREDKILFTQNKNQITISLK
ncbi:MAG: winged helix-turn-helix domain-containing protein [Candidatus Edwardsbacteria bacterium]|nr:winged helix-turn-helix domain-containing protein [Candidatus Edwardsbacteria bacterium]